MWRQPKSVWAVAFASTLNATPSQVLLLFTSYMAVMGVAMLVTGVVSYGPTSVARTNWCRSRCRCCSKPRLLAPGQPKSLLWLR